MEGTSCDDILPFMVEGRAGILWRVLRNDDDQKIANEGKIDDDPAMNQVQF